jgi:hypothetical protein
MRTLAGVLLCLVGLVEPVHGCGFCIALQGNALALPHPKAIEIAQATRAALDRGVLKENPLVASSLWREGGQGMTALERVPPPELVKAWAAKIQPKPRDSPALNMTFVFIDTEQTCGVVFRGGAVVYDSRPLGTCDTRVVTTRAAFYAIVAGELGVADAERLGVLCVEGEKRAADLLDGRCLKAP